MWKILWINWSCISALILLLSTKSSTSSALSASFIVSSFSVFTENSSSRAKEKNSLFTTLVSFAGVIMSSKNSVSNRTVGWVMYTYSVVPSVCSILLCPFTSVVSISPLYELYEGYVEVAGVPWEFRTAEPSEFKGTSTKFSSELVLLVSILIILLCKSSAAFSAAAL